MVKLLNTMKLVKPVKLLKLVILVSMVIGEPTGHSETSEIIEILELVILVRMVKVVMQMNIEIEGLSENCKITWLYQQAGYGYHLLQSWPGADSVAVRE